MRLLLVDDDPGLRTLLRTTFEVFDIAVEEAESPAAAEAAIETARPDAIVLDVVMPGGDGLAFCRKLKSRARTRSIPVILLTGSEGGTLVAADAAGADAFVRKPFSPLDLLGVVERLVGGLYGVPFRAEKPRGEQEQLILYARDLRHLLEVERGQRALLESAYQETVLALVNTLESKDTGTGAHSQRVQLYAIELARGIAPDLAEHPGLQYGFLLHDVGKIGIPDEILRKPTALTASERRLIRNHTILGEQMLSGVGILQGEGLQVVRSHHERWDGRGYPDGLAADAIPLGARIFAVADALDAITSDRPYHSGVCWADAEIEIVAQASSQFDPDVVEAFRGRREALRGIHHELAAA
ncbi:MAG: HD domain-containing phosphohydrolase [Gaiellaceae bacterium]